MHYADYELNPLKGLGIRASSKLQSSNHVRVMAKKKTILNHWFFVHRLKIQRRQNWQRPFLASNYPSIRDKKGVYASSSAKMKASAPIDKGVQSTNPFYEGVKKEARACNFLLKPT